MIRQTVDRLAALVSPERTLVVTGQRLVVAVREELPELPAASIVGEPCRRDTAPCIGLAALLVSRDDPDATMVVLPADHVISPPEVFQETIAQAADLVDDSPARLVTFGIKPTYPAESFGYIERDRASEDGGGGSATVYRVAQFREKPDASTAAEYLASGRYYWNSGIFVWRASTIIAALADRAPTMLDHLKRIVAAWETADQQDVFEREFAAIDGISIDYAVMEHATDVAVIEAPFHWDDVGSWQALARLNQTDADGNTVVGKHLGLDTKGTIIRVSDQHFVVTLGIEDCIVVHTPDATLVARKQDEEKVRAVVKELESKGLEEYL